MEMDKQTLTDLARWVASNPGEMNDRVGLVLPITCWQKDNFMYSRSVVLSKIQ